MIKQISFMHNIVKKYDHEYDSGLYNIFEMPLYPTLTKLVEENYFQQMKQFQIDVGFKLLEYMAFKICYLQLQDPKYFSAISQRMPQIIINELKISDKQHLGMCLGDIAQSGSYLIMNQIEGQIHRILKSKQLSKTISRPLSESVNAHSKTFDDSKTSFSGYEIQRQAKNSKSEMLKNINLSSIKNSIKKSNDSTFEINFLQDQPSFSLYEQGDVQTYLKMVQYKNSQLNYVNQLFKLNLDWKQESQGLDFMAVGKIIVPDLYTLKGDIEINGQGCARKKQTAKELASTIILRRLYEIYPNIFNKLIKQKKKKGLNY